MNHNIKLVYLQQSESMRMRLAIFTALILLNPEAVISWPLGKARGIPVAIRHAVGQRTMQSCIQKWKK